MKLLITGGTVFVSRYCASYFVDKGYEVFVLNRGNHSQVEGVRLFRADRHQAADVVQGHFFDAVLDITAYHDTDIKDLLDALQGNFKEYIFISSSAVYPQDNPQPFHEEQEIGDNVIWKDYGSEKCKAERYLLKRVPHAYILRPPYLYGPMQNLYREAFVFDCAKLKRPFYIPKDGSMPLQFFHVEDLCKVIEILFTTHPKTNIYNVGNADAVSINTFVEICYAITNTPLQKYYVNAQVEQRSYFPFYDYSYHLDVTRLAKLLPKTKDLREGLTESYRWYEDHIEEMKRKPLLEYIDAHQHEWR